MFGSDDEAGGLDPEEKPRRIKELVKALPQTGKKEADRIIREGTDTDDVIRQLEDLLDEYEPESADEAVRRADSLDQLRDLLYRGNGISSGVRRRVDSIRGTSTAELTDVVGEIPEEAKAEADTIISETNSADDAVANLNKTIDSFHQEEADDMIASADGIEDLGVDHDGSDGDDLSDTNVADDGVLSGAAQSADQTISDVQNIIKNAEPSEAAAWGIAAGVALGPTAAAAGTSTAVLMALSGAGGVSLGTYASGKENSLLDDVDPQQIAGTANMTARTAQTQTGRAVGGIVGGAQPLAQELVPEAYAQWITEIEPETVVAGAELGHDRLASKDGFTPRSGTAMGAGVGTLYGYLDDSEEEFWSLVDDDLAQEARKQLEA